MDERLREMCERLPVFPLPDAVLMPGALLPLHVFEPRYRDLVRHCLDGDGVMGIATLMPGYEDDYDGQPDLYDMVGVGELVAHEALPDGRYHILLRYVGRARIEHEHAAEHAFRVVHASLRDDDPAGADAGLARLKMLLFQLGARTDDDDDDPQRAIREGGLELVDRVAQQVLRGSELCRRYLGHDRVLDRIALVEDALAAILAERATNVAEA